MPYDAPGTVVWSNDGKEQLYVRPGPSNYVTVTKEGLMEEDLLFYKYEGDKIFIGIATTPNATVPDYAIGDTFNSNLVTMYIVEREKTQSVTFDLSTLNLSAGTHEITVKARASGYKDSEESKAVNYVVQINEDYITDLTGTTWHIPAGWTAEAGYGVFNIKAIHQDEMMSDFQIGYSSDPDGAFGDMKAEKDSIVYAWAGSNYGAFDPSDEFTLSITGGTDVTNEKLIAWLKANGKRVITFTIEGTTYYAEDGMTWGEWVESEYNTGGFYIDTVLGWAQCVVNGEMGTNSDGKVVLKCVHLNASQINDAIPVKIIANTAYTMSAPSYPIGEN